MNIYDYKPENILFLDIETVPQFEKYADLSEDLKNLWGKKARYIIKTDENESLSDTYQKAGIYSEFGKIICISTGYIKYSGNKKSLCLNSFFGHDESTILQDFCKKIETFSQDHETFLAAHNGKEFDFPYLARRIVINGLKLPKALQVAGKKPWETTFIDTLELWKFGDYKHYTSLELLTHILGIPSPKEEIDGSKVATIYYEEKNLERIVKYCEKDVTALTQIFLKFRGEAIIPEENITSLTWNKSKLVM